MPRWFSLLIMIVSSLPVSAAADPHPACRAAIAPAVPVDAAELRSIATSCRPGPRADLWYNRAYHAELLDRYRSMMQLEAYWPQEDARNYYSYRLFIALSEALALQTMEPDSTDTVVWLNSIYDRAGEVAEMRLKGYDLQADRLEARLWTE